MEAKCKNCEETKGFYRTNGALWCNVCGHKKTAAKHPSHENYSNATAERREK